MKLKNYSVEKFLSLPQQQQRDLLCVLPFVKGKNFIKVGFLWKKKKGIESLTQLKFKEVAQLKQLFKSGNFADMLEAVRLVYQIKNPLKLGVFEFYSAVNFISEELKKIYQVEAERYQPAPTKYDHLLHRAGAEAMHKFHDIATLDTLAGGDILKIEKIENLPYLLVHFYLWYKTEKENINIKFQELVFAK